ncbi:MAG: nitroreductase family protein [Lachnospiraceae bacterium]|nr:nitroreductase family protein [Lachnospiraceae bacterium]
MELLDMMLNRRSVREYTGEHIPGDKLEMILQAGLAAPTGRGKQPWEFIVVQRKEALKKLSECRTGSAKMLENADCAIVVIADETEQDVWTEDCSIAMAYMHLMADSLGIGSCWIQGRLREAPDGRSTEDYVRECLGFPGTYRLEAILSLGIPEKHPIKRHTDQLPMEKVHLEKF